MIPGAARGAASVVMLRPAPPSPSTEPTTSPRRPARLRAFLATVAVLGFAVLVPLAIDAADVLADAPAVLWVLAAFLLLGELLPIKVPGHEDEVTTSSSFTYTLLVLAGLAPAAVAQAVGSLVADLITRRPPLAAAFNVGQVTLALAAGGAVLEALTDLPRAGDPPFAVGDLPAIFASAAVFFVVNNLLAGTAAALASNRPLLGFLREDLGFQVFVAAILLGFSPVVAAAADAGLYLGPLLLLPLVAVYRGGQAARMSEHRALHDQLTGLPNRLLFQDRVAQTLRQARRGRSRLAVLLMDLDRFKEVNDTLGHHHGDLLLQQVGPRLLAELREGDTVARLGGDEFAIVLPSSTSPTDAAIVAERLRVALERPFPIDDLSIEVSASIGIACHPEHGDDVETLVQRADVAMYLAKEGRSGVRLYAAEHDRHSVDRLELAGQLRHAIEHDLVLHFQPKVELATGRLAGAEALVRWDHPTRGLLRPDAFVPLAENLGLIRPLTHRAVAAAVAQVAAWRADGLDLTVAVNISAQDLLDHALIAEVDAVLAEHGLGGEVLELEITESTLMGDPRRADGVLQTLRARGVRVAIDDFGTGYSSLAYLRRLPIHAVKIDKSFVLELAAHDHDVAIVTAIVDLAHNLGLRTVAEGVEDAVAYSRLRRMGCDLAQGYLLSRPMRANDFSAWAAGWSADRAS